MTQRENIDIEARTWVANEIIYHSPGIKPYLMESIVYVPDISFINWLFLVIYLQSLTPSATLDHHRILIVVQFRICIITGISQFGIHHQLLTIVDDC